MTREGPSPLLLPAPARTPLGPAAPRPRPRRCSSLPIAAHQVRVRGSAVTPWRAKGHPRPDLPRGRRSSSRGLHDDAQGARGARWERRARGCVCEAGRVAGSSKCLAVVASSPGKTPRPFKCESQLPSVLIVRITSNATERNRSDNSDVDRRQ